MHREYHARRSPVGAGGRWLERMLILVLLGRSRCRRAMSSPCVKHGHRKIPVESGPKRGRPQDRAPPKVLSLERSDCHVTFVHPDLCHFVFYLRVQVEIPARFQTRRSRLALSCRCSRHRLYINLAVAHDRLGAHDWMHRVHPPSRARMEFELKEASVHTLYARLTASMNPRPVND